MVVVRFEIQRNDSFYASVRSAHEPLVGTTVSVRQNVGYGPSSTQATYRFELRLHRGDVPCFARGGVQRAGVSRGEPEQVQGGLCELRETGCGQRERRTCAIGAVRSVRVPRRVRHKSSEFSLSHVPRVRRSRIHPPQPRGGRRTSASPGVARRGWSVGCGISSGRDRMSVDGTLRKPVRRAWSGNRASCASRGEKHLPSVPTPRWHRSGAAWPPARTGTKARWRWCEACRAR